MAAVEALQSRSRSYQTGQEIHMNVRTITQPPAPPGAEAPTDEWYRVVAVAAYLRAERRGFEGGSALDDWLEAETELKRTRGLQERPDSLRELDSSNDKPA